MQIKDNRRQSHITHYVKAFSVSRGKCVLTVILSVLALCTPLKATEPYSFTRYTRANGLPTTTIEDMLQDANGYIYLASWSGLYRFNGKQFVNYKAVASAEQSSDHATNRFVKIETDTEGRLWILASDGAVYRFDPQQGKMERTFPKLNIVALYKLSSDDFCFVDDNRTVYRCYYPKNKTGDVLSLQKYFSMPTEASPNGIVKDSSGNIYILSDEGIYCNGKIVSDIPAYTSTEYDDTYYFGGSEGRIVKLSHGDKSIINTGTDGDTDLIAHLSDGVSFVIGSSDKGLYEFNLYDYSLFPIKNSRTYHGDKLQHVTDIRGNLWIWSSQGGLYKYDQGNHELIPFYNNKLQDGWSSETFVNSVLSDKQGNIWISESWGGLERVIFHEGTFKFFSVDGSRDIKPETSIRAVFRNNEGIIFVASKDGKVHLYTPEFKPITTWNTIDPVYSIAQSKDGCIWFGTKGGGIIENSNTFGYNPRRFSPDDTYFGINGEQIYCINTEDESRIWIGSFDGSVSYIDMTDKERRFISKKNLLSFPTSQQNKIRYIRFSPERKMFVCGNLGLFVCENPSAAPENIRFKHFSNTTDIDIQHLLFTHNGDLYASTFGNGFLHFNNNDPESGFQAFTTNEGLLSNFVFSAIEDKYGIIWIATYGGLNQYNPDTGSMIGYSYEDIGIKAGFNEGEPMIGDDGNIYFSTTSGLLHFNPAEISNSDFVPRLLITYCSISGKQIDADTGKPIRMKRKDYIRIVLCAIDMTAPHRVRYAYRIERAKSIRNPDEEEWETIGNDGQIRIENLKRGKYLLHMRSTNGDGLTVNNETTLRIDVSSNTGIGRLILILMSSCLIPLAAAFFIYFRKHSKKGNNKDNSLPDDDNTVYSEEELFKKNFTTYLEKELDNGELAINDMASAMNMSRSTLFEKSKNALGLPPIEYLRKLRFERAAELLRKGDIPVSSIAYMTGFNDPHYFSKAFKKESGLTPSAYRQSYNEGKI